MYSMNGIISYLISFSFNNISLTPIKKAGYAKTVAKKKKRKAINGNVVNSKIMQNFIVSKKYSKMETI